MGVNGGRLRPRPPCGGGKGWGVAPTARHRAFRRSLNFIRLNNPGQPETHGPTPSPASPTRGEES